MNDHPSCDDARKWILDKHGRSVRDVQIFETEPADITHIPKESYPFSRNLRSILRPPRPGWNCCFKWVQCVAGKGPTRFYKKIYGDKAVLNARRKEKICFTETEFGVENSVGGGRRFDFPVGGEIMNETLAMDLPRAKPSLVHWARPCWFPTLQRRMAVCPSRTLVFCGRSIKYCCWPSAPTNT